MAYTDLELKNATQVAYNFDEEITALNNAGRTPPYKIEELCKQRGKSVNEVLPDLDGQDVSNWKIVACCDDNSDSGFYGCLIDMGDGRSILAFRGSEGMDDLHDLETDWIQSDLLLMNNTLTRQQAKAEEFLKTVSEEYIDDFDSIAMTGHSLGGNLAEHTAIMSVEYPNVYNKLERCVNYDGPGYSDEYIERNRLRIEKAAEKITHYEWSIVGGMMNEVPGTERVQLAVKPAEGSLLDQVAHYLAGRHDTKYIDFNKNDGSAIRGEDTLWNEMVSLFTKGIDRLPDWVGDTLVSVVAVGLYIVVWSGDKITKDGQLTPYGTTLITLAAFCFLSNPVGTIVTVLSVILVVIAAIVIVAAVEYVIECFEEVISMIVEAIEEHCGWLIDKLDEIKDFMAKAVNDLKTWFNKNFNNGYKYALANPCFSLNTYTLTQYARRLRNVNKRISALDRRMDSLYGKVKLEDLWSLIQADFMTTGSLRINKCISYLETTSSEFEKNELNLKKLL